MDVDDRVRDQRTWLRMTGAGSFGISGIFAVVAACGHDYLHRGTSRSAFASGVARGVRSASVFCSAFLAVQGFALMEVAQRLERDANVEMSCGPLAVALERPRIDSLDDPIHVRLRWSLSWPPGS